MNKVLLVGNLTKDPELRTTSNNNYVCSFTVAVQRMRKNNNGEKQADYINCVAWGKQAESVAKYLSKGRKVGVTGSLQTRTYEDKDGKRVYVTEIVCDDFGGVEFLTPRSANESTDSKENEAAAAAYSAEPSETKYVEVTDEELPF